MCESVLEIEIDLPILHCDFPGHSEMEITFHLSDYRARTSDGDVCESVLKIEINLPILNRDFPVVRRSR